MSFYLVTGGAGFIGSHLVDELVRRGERVRVVDDLSTGRLENLSQAGGVEFVRGDLADAVVADSALRGITDVLHIAAIPSVPRSVGDPVATNRANIDGTLNVLAAARAAGVRRVVLASSSSIYGNTPTLPKHEGMPPSPLSPYALQKLVGEQYARLFTDLYGLETVAVRYFNVFGPRQSPTSQYSGVISLFIAALVEGRPPTIYGDGEQTRDFTYVANVVDGTLRASRAPGANGRAINIATGGRVSLNRLFEALRDLIGGAITPMKAEPRAGDVNHSQADITLARDLLGYEPRISFEEGLRRTVAWYREARTVGQDTRGSDEQARPPGRRAPSP